MIITQGLGKGGNLLLLGMGSVIIIVGKEIFVEEEIGGQIRRYPLVRKLPKIRYDKETEEFINELTEKILKTGVVRNVHKPYDPRHNRRYKVSRERAIKIAYSIAKAKGMCK